MRYIYFFKKRINFSCRDNLFKVLISRYKSIHDLRCAFDHTEIASFDNIDKNIIPEYIFYRKISENDQYQFADGISFMVQERFWEAHEAFEYLWKNSNGMEKLTIRFIIMVCTAFVHLQRGHYKIYNEVMNNALKIDTYIEFNGLNIKLLRQSISLGMAHAYFFIKSLNVKDYLQDLNR